MIIPYLLLVIIVLILVPLLFKQLQRIKKLEERLANLIEVQEVREIKAQLAGRDMARSRIAKDWHDGIGNSLSTLKLLLDTIKASNLERYQATLNLMLETQVEFRQIIEQENTVNFSTRDDMLRILEKWQYRLGLGNIVLEFEVFPLKQYELADASLSNHFYRIIQELINNTIKHAAASKIHIKILEEEKGIRLVVQDNGNGIKASDKEQQLLKTVRNRVRVLNGTLSIRTEDKKGTIIDIYVPFVSAQCDW